MRWAQPRDGPITCVGSVVREGERWKAAKMDAVRQDDFSRENRTTFI